MSLDVANNVARQSLIAAQSQIALSGRNIAAAGDPTRSRAVAVTTTTIDGGVRVSGIRRAEDLALYTRMIEATAATAARDAELSHLAVMADTIGDPAHGGSPAALVGTLGEAISAYANAPDDPLFGREVVARANDIAGALNKASSELVMVRERADHAMADSVAAVNDLLAEFDAANAKVVHATVMGRDATADLDRRDAIVATLSEHLGVTTLVRENNDVALFTDGGVTLFDRTARKVTFERTATFTTATVGGTVHVDGLAITGDDAPMPSRGGSIVGNAKVRDELAPTYSLQLDEIARVLSETFEDGVGSLFVTTPPDHAGTIAVAAAVDPTRGGTVENLRDGTGNPAGYAAYSDRLLALTQDLGTAVAFDAEAELGGDQSLADFAAGSVGWLEGMRAHVTERAETERTILMRASDALSRATGVNMDDEYAQQLMIERHFAASSRLIAIIDEMFDELLRTV